MKFNRRLRAVSAEERARFALLDALDSIRDPNYRQAASRIASEIRQGGARGALFHVSDAAPYASLAGMNPVVSALAAYAREGHGYNLTALPAPVERQRRAEDQMAERVARSQQRRLRLRQDRQIRQFQELITHTRSTQ